MINPLLSMYAYSVARETAAEMPQGHFRGSCFSETKPDVRFGRNTRAQNCSTGLRFIEDTT